MSSPKPRPKRIVAYKCTRPDGTDFRTGKLNYAEALAKGVAVEVPDPDPARGQICGRGVHVSPTARKTCRFGDRDHRPWRWFKGYVEAPDLIEQDSEKMRVRRFRPTKELTLADVFGADLAERVTKAREEIGTWASIPWLKPAGEVSEATLRRLFLKWHKAMGPWLAKGRALPKEMRIVRTVAAAADAAAASAADASADAAASAAASAAADAAVAAASADASADADAAAADADAAAADAAAASAADASAAAADAAAASAADASADAADAVADAADAAAAADDAADDAADAAAADAADDAADAADAVADADAAALYRRWSYWPRWYVRPRSVLWRSARWKIAGMDKPSPWEPLVAMYRLGVLPIGYSCGKFVIYVPKLKAKGVGR